MGLYRRGVGRDRGVFRLLGMAADGQAGVVARPRNGVAGAVEQVVTEYGLERTKYVLAAAIQTRDGDGRISRTNRKWADFIRTIKDMDRRGFDRSCYYADLQAHTCLLDGFVSQVRKFEKAKGQPAQDTPER